MVHIWLKSQFCKPLIGLYKQCIVLIDNLINFPGPFSTSSVKMDSARQNLASSFVNGFVNAAFGKDKLLTEDGNKWIYKHNDHGMI